MKFLLPLFLIIPFNKMMGQSARNTHQIHTHSNREIAITSSCALWSGINYTIQISSPKIPAHFRSFEMKGLDDLHRYSYNKPVSRISDVTAVLTMLAGGLSIMKQPKNEWMSKGLVMGQSLWISVNLAQSLKLTVLRSRPYTHAPGFIPSKRDDYYSFYSGHSAAVASVLTSAWLMRNKNTTGMSYKGQNTIPLVCTVLGVSTALLRIFAGKHYPSDVLAGITTGIGIAYINYRIHEK